MTEYGVVTNNAFALLGLEDEEEDRHVAVEAAPAPAASPHASRGRSRGRGTIRGGRKTDAPTRETKYDGDEGGEAHRSSHATGSRGRGRGFQGRGKRQYDRHDGTGRGHEYEKRHGGGKGNWGVSGEIEAPTEGTAPGWGTTEESQELPQNDGRETTKEEEDGAQETVEETEKEDPKPEPKQVFTLAEYEEMMKEKTVMIVPVKKDTPVVDKHQFDGMAVLKKSNEASGFEALAVERNRKKKEKTMEKEVETVEVGFWVGEGRGRGRGRRGRSRDFDEGRGRGRGRSRDFDEGRRWDTEGGPSDHIQQHSDQPRGRGRGRPFRGRGRSYQRPIDIESDSAFPSLSG